MKKACGVIGVILLSNTYTYFITKPYMHKKYPPIRNADIPKNENPNE